MTKVTFSLSLSPNDAACMNVFIILYCYRPPEDPLYRPICCIVLSVFSISLDIEDMQAVDVQQNGPAKERRYSTTTKRNPHYALTEESVMSAAKHKR